MYFSRVNTYTVSSARYSGGEQRWHGRVPNILCCTWQSSAWPKRGCLSVMLCSTGQGIPQKFSSSYGSCWRPKAIFITHCLQLTITYYLQIHGIIPLLCMENAVKSVLQLSQVKQPHLNPDSVHVGYLSRFPGVYCRRKATQIWSLNLDSFLSSYSHSQKKVLVSFCFSMDGIKLAA